MWKLLPFILLASCAANKTADTTSNEDLSDNFRTVHIQDVALGPVLDSDRSESLTREFRDRDTRGWINATGAWNLTSPVVHTRLRCATYETGIQIGKGNPACSQVKWLTDIKYGSRRTQCNNAIVIHTGEGEFTEMRQLFEHSTCVRVVTRCKGPC